MAHIVRFTSWSDLFKPYLGDKERLQAEIEALFQQKELHFKKKQFGQKTVYTLNLNFDSSVHRLVFEKVEDHYILRAIAFNHDYDKALTWESLTHDEFKHIRENTLAEKEIEPVIENAVVARYFLQDARWLKMTPQQEAILMDLDSLQGEVTYPVAIVAPPGAGKTSLIMLALQESALRYQEQEDTVKFLCLVPSEPGKISKLKRTLEEQWAAWAKDHLTTARIEMVIADSEEFSQRYFALQQPPRIAVPLAHCEQYIRRRLNCSIEEAATIYQEFLLASVLLNKDLEESHRFSDSYYQKAGKKQTMVSMEKKEGLYQLYQDYMSSLARQNLYHPSLSVMTPTTEEQRFHRVMVDETQQFSTQQLTNALNFAMDGKCVYAGDSRQNTQYLTVSPIAVLGAFLHLLTNGEVNISTKTLEKTHRLSPDVARLGAALVNLQDNLCGGVPDKFVYSNLLSASLLPDTQAVFFIQELSADFQALGQDAKVAAIALQEHEVELAASLINTANAFSSNNVHGLEFNKVCIFISKECQNKLRQFSDAMAAKNITAETLLPSKVNLSAQVIPKELEEGIALLTRLFVALSRSTNQAYIYWESNKKQPARHFQKWLAYQCHVGRDEKKNSSAVKIEVVVSSKEEWLENINYLIRNQFYKQAQDNLMKQFGLQKAEVTRYMDHLQATSLSIAQCLEFIEHMKQATASSSLAKKPSSSETASKPSESLDKSKVAAKKEDIPLLVRDFKYHSEESRLVANIITILEGTNATHWLCGYELPEYNKSIFELIFQDKRSFIRLYMGLQGKEGVMLRLVNAVKPHFHKRLKENRDTYLQLLIMRFAAFKMGNGFFEIYSKIIVPQLSSEIINTPYSSAEESGISILIILLRSLSTAQIVPFFNMCCLRITKEGLSQPILNGKERGKNALYLLLKEHPVMFFRNQQHFLKLVTKEALHCACAENTSEQGITPFYLLCASPPGRKLLSENWQHFQKNITKELLHLPATGEGNVQGVTPFYLLCGCPDGIQFLHENWNFFRKNITQESLHSPTTGNLYKGTTPFYLLCGSQEGRRFLLEHWSFFSTKLTKEQLHRVITDKNIYQGTTPFHMLCNSITLLREHWDFFQANTSHEQLHLVVVGDAPYSGVTPFYLLCTTAEGLSLVQEHWDFFQKSITQENLNALVTGRGPYFGTTPFDKLCDHPIGCQLLEDHWMFFQDKLTANQEQMFRRSQRVQLLRSRIAPEERAISGSGSSSLSLFSPTTQTTPRDTDGYSPSGGEEKVSSPRRKL